MLRKIVDISTDGYFLNHERGFLILNNKQSSEKLQIPLTDISVLVLTAKGISLTKDLIVSLINSGSVLVICGNKYTPETIITPLFGNYEFSGRLKTQISSSLPLRKRIWQSIIKEKIYNQAVLLENLGMLSDSIFIKNISLDVKSGDVSNREAYAAKKYWEVIYGKGFLRNQDGEDLLNAFLNYGYAVLRGMVARSVCSAGLHPSLGLFHHNEFDNMCLVDDLMEPFRVIIDMMVYKFYLVNKNENINDWKKLVIHQLPDYKIKIKNEVTKMSIGLDIYANSLMQSFEMKENIICIPQVFMKN